MALCGINGYVSGTLNVIICSIPLFFVQINPKKLFLLIYSPQMIECVERALCVYLGFIMKNEEGMTTQGE